MDRSLSISQTDLSATLVKDCRVVGVNAPVNGSTGAFHFLMGPLCIVIDIVPSQSHWPGEFRKLAVILQQGLGTAALRIDHIGSTAVPGLAAKDIIDIQISVASLDEAVFVRLTALGYSRVNGITADHRPPGELSADCEWEKWFFRPPAGQRPTNTHVRVLGRANQQYPLLFRDYLRAHPLSAAAYAELKRRLARELKDITQYPDVKDPAVDLIYLAAQDWAATTGWKMGSSDLLAGDSCQTAS